MAYRFTKKQTSKMKKTIIAAVLLLIALGASAKRDDKYDITVGHYGRIVYHLGKSPDTMPSPRLRLGIWFIPVTRSTQIDGVAVGLLTAAFGGSPYNHSLTINGINIEANPLALMFLPYAIVGGVTSSFSRDSGELKHSSLGQLYIPVSRYVLSYDHKRCEHELRVVSRNGKWC